MKIVITICLLLLAGLAIADMTNRYVSAMQIRWLSAVPTNWRASVWVSQEDLPEYVWDACCGEWIPDPNHWTCSRQVSWDLGPVEFEGKFGLILKIPPGTQTIAISTDSIKFEQVNNTYVAKWSQAGYNREERR